MPAKDKAAEPAKTSAERKQAISAQNQKDQAASAATVRKERAAEAALNDAKQSALIERQRKVKPDPEGDIDQRMAALLQDHKDMGAR